MTADCTLVIHNPSELLAAVPFLMGYHPADSVAVVGLAGREITFAACYDLPPPHVRADAATIAETVARQSIGAVVVIGYGPADRVTPATAHLTGALRKRHVRVLDTMRVTGARWWSYTCDDPHCCPPDGTPCLPTDNVIAAEATFRGIVALPSRAALTAQVASLDGPARDAMVAATGHARKRFTELIAEVPADQYGRVIRKAGRTAVRDAERKYRTGETLTEDEVAWLGAMLADRIVLEFAMERTVGDDWRIRLWTDVLRRVEPAYVAAPACLLSYAAWRSGNGPLARVAIDRALREEPGHRLAGLLHEVLGRGIGPHMLDIRPAGGPRRGTRRPRRR